MRLVRVCFVIVAILGAPLWTVPAGASGTQCPGTGHSYEPDAGKTLLLIGQDQQSIDDYSKGTGVDPGGEMLYTSIAAPTLGTVVPYSIGAGLDDMQYELVRYPNSTIQIGLQLTNQLDNVNKGLLDTNIQSLAIALRNVKHPVYLRIGYEFDNPANAYDPVKYKAAFQRIVDHMRANGANNVAYVWHATAAGFTYGGLPTMDWYPGPCYVDWVGASVFGGGYVGTNSLVEANKIADLAATLGHPMMICESTPVGAITPTADGNVLWNNWYVPVSNFVATRGVKAWSYINANWNAQPFWSGQNWGDTRVEANPALKAHWLSLITQPSYLNASPTLSASLHYP